MRRRRRPFRKIASALRPVARKYRGFRQGLSSVVRRLADVSEVPVSAGGIVARRRPTAANYLNPVFWVLQAFWFIVRYLTSRNLIAGLQGLPALVGLVTPVVAGFWIVRSTDDRIAYADNRMDYYLANDDLERADFYSRQMCFLAHRDPDVLLSRAQLLDRMGRGEEAVAISIQLAREFDHLPAMEWLSEKELQAISQSGVVDEARDAQLVNWLTWIIRKEPRHLRANFMLGTLRMMRGHYIRAVKPLQTVTQYSREPIPEAWYSLAVCEDMLGNTEAAQASASTAADRFLERDAARPFELQRCLQTLRALVLAGREPEAATLIRQVMPQQPAADQAQLQWLLGDVYARMCERLRTKERRTPEDLARAIDAIYRGLAAAQTNPVVLEELTRLSCSSDIDDTSLQRQLATALDSGVSPGLVHFILGTRLLTQDPPDTDAALQHFQLAETHHAGLPGLLNNIADALVESDDADLDRALRLVNQALDLMPDQPHFFDTRGKILLRQGETLKAIADFERALAAPEIRAVVHDSLAEAWAELGNDEQQQRHRRLAESYRSAESAADSEPARAVVPSVTPPRGSNSLPEPDPNAN